MHALHVSAEFMQREPKPFLSPLASPRPSECLWYKRPSLLTQPEGTDELPGMPSSCAQGMATKGRDSSLGLLGTGTALGPAPQRTSCLPSFLHYFLPACLPSFQGCWAEGWQAGLRWAGLRMGGPLTPTSQCHCPATQQSQCPGAGYKGASSSVPLPELACGQLKGI